MDHPDHVLPYGRQTITEDDIIAVVDVLRSSFLTQGPAVPVQPAVDASEAVRELEGDQRRGRHGEYMQPPRREGQRTD